MSKQQIEKWIDLSELPRYYKGIDWKNSIGYKCKFKYDNIYGEIEIVNYVSKTHKLTIKYLDYDLFEIQTGNFTDCKLGKMLKIRTDEFKLKIGKVIKDDRRDLTIIDKEYIYKNNQNWKYYKYHCNKCGNEDIIIETSLLTQKSGCNVCNASISKPKLGINTIYDTDKWMIDLGISEEDAKKYTHGSNKKIKVKCPNCGRKKYISIDCIYSKKSICCSCGDGTSYPEKFVISFLDQLNINYIKEYSPKWSNNKRYDFYFELSNKKYIIETHGGQHYRSSEFITSTEKEQENDKYKKELALSNGVDIYIELDCRESNSNYIKNSISNSKLNKIFDLNKIDWLKCEEFALTNKVKEVCDYWHLHNDINNENLTIGVLSNIFKLSSDTIRNYLKKGSELNWCSYIPIYFTERKVEIFDKNMKSLGIFKNCCELERQSEKLFGVKLFNTAISAVALGKIKQYKGFTFKYI